MSIENEINRISTNVQETLNAIEEMGGTVPEGATSNEMPAAARTIPIGAKIDDSAPAADKTYSSQKIDALLSEQKKAIDEEVEKKLDASALPTAINTALAQAKESDEFKGDPGDAGKDGEAATFTFTGAESLPYGSAPTVTEEAGSTAQARRYKLGIPEGKPGANGEGGGGTGGRSDFTRIIDVTLEEDVAEIVIPQTTEIKDAFNAANEISITLHAAKADTTTATADGPVTICQRFSWGDGREIVGNVPNVVIHTGNTWKKDVDLLITGQRAVTDNGFAGTNHKNTIFVCTYVYETSKYGVAYAYGLDAVSLVVKTKNNNLFGIGTRFIVAVR